ncbi:hypothetical protein MKX01_019831 [Papaver californicum]|nr:hypothetical protein MKX01_019831 [Papaver californicum]
MDATDWRTQLQPDSRQSIVNKIMETLKRHLPISGPEGLKELYKSYLVTNQHNESLVCSIPNLS